MDTDDRQVGRILTRREVLALFSAAGMAALVGCGPSQATTPTSSAQPSSTSAPATNAPATAAPTTAPATALPTIATTAVPTAAPTTAPTAAAAAPTSNVAALPACVVRPELTEGPYFVDGQLNRSDIRADPATGTVSQGAPLLLTFNVSAVNSSGCAALPGAIVDVWHCDAAGVYSDVAGPGAGSSFLRGYQTTDANGMATFTTIYPGWYPGRAVHIHFKVRHHAAGQTAEFTSQLFFDDAFTDQVFTQAPYDSRGQRNRLNSNDGIFDPQLLVTVTQDAQGYAARFDIGLDKA